MFVLKKGRRNNNNKKKPSEWTFREVTGKDITKAVVYQTVKLIKRVIS